MSKVALTYNHTKTEPDFSSWGMDDDSFEKYLDGTPKMKIPPPSQGMKGACHTTHKPLPITVDGITYNVYGGSCITPVINDMDTFVGLDYGMKRTTRYYPWNKGTEFLYSITDMKAPANAEEFAKLIEFLGNEVLEGRKVFVGCIGGHGRTGTVFSALVAHLTGIADATTYVREHYCHKAVESTEQINFLNQHYGVTKVSPTKGLLLAKGQSESYPAKKEKSYQAYTSLPKHPDAVTPVMVDGQIHGKNKIRHCA